MHRPKIFWWNWRRLYQRAEKATLLSHSKVSHNLRRFAQMYTPRRQWGYLHLLLEHLLQAAKKHMRKSGAN